jgi:hypothetical protein
MVGVLAPIILETAVMVEVAVAVTLHTMEEEEAEQVRVLLAQALQQAATLLALVEVGLKGVEEDLVMIAEMLSLLQERA